MCRKWFKELKWNVLHDQNFPYKVMVQLKGTARTLRQSQGQALLSFSTVSHCHFTIPEDSSGDEAFQPDSTVTTGRNGEGEKPSVEDQAYLLPLWNPLILTLEKMLSLLFGCFPASHLRSGNGESLTFWIGNLTLTFLDAILPICPALDTLQFFLNHLVNTWSSATFAESFWVCLWSPSRRDLGK